VTVSVSCATNVQLEAEFMLWYQSAHYVGCLTRNSPRLHRFSAHRKLSDFSLTFCIFSYISLNIWIPWLFQFSRKSGNHVLSNKSDYFDKLLWCMMSGNGGGSGRRDVAVIRHCPRRRPTQMAVVRRCRPRLWHRRVPRRRPQQLPRPTSQLRPPSHRRCHRRSRTYSA